MSSGSWICDRCGTSWGFADLRAEVARLAKIVQQYQSVLYEPEPEQISTLKTEVARLRGALEEIRDQRCDCGCPLDGGQHFHDCVTGSNATFIARAALEGKP